MVRTLTLRELSRKSTAVLDAVEFRSEHFIITCGGRAVARLQPIERRREGLSTDEIRLRFAGLPPMDYAALLRDIEEFFGDDDRIRNEDYE